MVGSEKDSLHSQTKAMVQDLNRLLVELNCCLKHSGDDKLRGLVAQAMLLISFGQLPIVAVPVLVRPADKQQSPSDYGCFRDDPSGYPPAAIQFCVARIEGTLEELAAAVSEQARTAQCILWSSLRTSHRPVPPPASLSRDPHQIGRPPGRERMCT